MSSTNSNQVAPIMVDLGKKNKKRIKSLKRGRGKLAGEVEQTVARVRTGVSSTDGNVQLVPVVLIYKKKVKKKKKYKKQIKKMLPSM